MNRPVQRNTFNLANAGLLLPLRRRARRYLHQCRCLANRNIKSTYLWSLSQIRIISIQGMF